MNSNVKICFKRYILTLIIVILSVGYGLLCILCLGNPQWNKYIYIWRVEVYPKREPKVPQGFSGVYKRWNSNGKVSQIFNYTNGVLDGEVYKYLISKDEVFTPLRLVYRQGKPWEGFFENHKQGKLSDIIRVRLPIINTVDMSKQVKRIVLCEHFEKGILHGECHYYLWGENFTVCQSIYGQYHKGVACGQWFFKDENDKIITVVDYGYKSVKKSTAPLINPNQTKPEDK